MNNVLGNLANRVFSFAIKHFDGTIAKVDLDKQCTNTLAEADALLQEVSSQYAEYQVKRNTKSIMDIARLGNKFFDERKPWTEIKTNPQHVQQSLWVCVSLLSKISVALHPIMPKHTNILRSMMSLPPVQTWQDQQIDSDIMLKDVKPLFTKIEDATIEDQLAKLKASAPAEKVYEPVKEQISYEDFSKMDIRLAKILAAEAVPKTDKLLKLKIDLGFETRELVAGIAQSYQPEEIVGKVVTMLVNLEPRKIRGILSSGMILAAHSDDKIRLLLPDGGSPGSVVQ